MKLFFAILAGIVLIVFAPMYLSPAPDNSKGEAVTGLPWQVAIEPDGSTRVFGLVPGKSTLLDAHQYFGEGETALVGASDETGSLELYFDTVTLAGAITGKLIVTADLPAATLAAMRERAVATEYMKTGNSKKSTLAEADLPAANGARILAIAFIPSANLDDAIVVQRFGSPAERVTTSATASHLLYPERGIDILLDQEGKEIIQYVAPKDFARLRDPLVAATTQAASAGSPVGAGGAGGTGSTGGQ